MAILNTRKRFQLALNRQFDGDANTTLISYGWFRRSGDTGLLIQARVLTGQIGIRLDGGGSNEATIDGTNEVSVDILALSAGAHTIELVALVDGTCLDLAEIHVQALESA